MQNIKNQKGNCMSKTFVWEQVKGNILTPGGDPLYICPVCRDKKSQHINGIETPNHLKKCPVCKTKLKYPYER